MKAVAGAVHMDIMGYAATFVGVKRQNIIVVPALFSTCLKLGTQL
jgi:hypothetical protein